MLLPKWPSATALKVVAIPWRTWGFTVCSRKAIAAETKNASRTLYWATAWRMGICWVRNSITATGLPSWLLTSLLWLKRAALKVATLSVGMTQPERNSVPTATRWIEDRNHSRLFSISFAVPSNAEFGRRTWSKYVRAWSIGWQPVRGGKGLSIN